MSDDIKITDGTILEALNGKVDLDGGNYAGSGLEAIVKKNGGGGGGGTGLQMFDTILKDYILTYEESKGLALQGTYVYKDAVAGSHYGYPDFYNKCLKEYQNSNTEQVYLKSNVTVVGSPTDNKGLLSGFSKTNYVTLPNHFLTAVANADTWETEFRFTTGSSVTSPERQIIFHSGVGSATSGVGGLVVDIYRGNLRISYDTNNASGATAQITVSTYTEYFIKATFDYSTLTFSSYYKLNENADWTLINSLSVNGRLAESANWNTTEMGNSSTETSYYFTGTINLNNCYINIDGKRWWSGGQVLEYKKNANGHSFYDIAEKETIDELFTSTGIAWFYGIDTENERVFLPRNNWFEQDGDISVKKLLYICVGNTTNYEGITDVVNQGMEILEQVNIGIESRVKLDGSNAEFPHIVETYKNGDSWYRVYSDGWCEQGGLATMVAQNATVTFLKPFANTSYSVVTTVDSGMATFNGSTGSVNVSSTVARVGSYNTKTISSFRINEIGGPQPGASGLGYVCWVARGYIA